MSAASLMHGAGLEGGHTVLEQADEQEAAGSDATLPRELEAARQALRASESKLQSNREQWAQATSDIVAQMAEQQRKSQALETKLRSELSAKDSALKEAMQGIGREQVDKLAKARTNEQNTLKELARKVDHLSKTNQEMSASESSARVRADQLERQVGQLVRQKIELSSASRMLQAELAAAKEEVYSLHAELKQSAAKVFVLEQEIAQTANNKQGRSAHVEQMLRVCQQDLERMAQLKDTAVADRLELQTRASEQQDRLRALDQTVAYLTGQVEDLKSECEELKSKKALLLEEQKLFEDCKSELESSRQETEQAVEQLQRKLDTMVPQSELDRVMRESKQAVEQLQHKLDTMVPQSELDRIMASHSELQRELSAVKMKSDRMGKELEMQRRKAYDLQLHREQEEREHEEKMRAKEAQWMQENAALLQQHHLRDTANKEREQLARELSIRRVKEHSLQEEVDTLRFAVAELESQLQDSLVQNSILTEKRTSPAASPEAAVVIKKEKARAQRAAARPHYDQLLDDCPLMALLSDGSCVFFDTQKERQTKGSEGKQAAQQVANENQHASVTAEPAADERLHSEVDTLQRKVSDLEQAVSSQRHEMQVLLDQKDSEAKNFQVAAFTAPFCLPRLDACLLCRCTRADDTRACVVSRGAQVELQRKSEDLQTLQRDLATLKTRFHETLAAERQSKLKAEENLSTRMDELQTLSTALQESKRNQEALEREIRARCATEKKLEQELQSVRKHIAHDMNLQSPTLNRPARKEDAVRLISSSPAANNFETYVSNLRSMDVDQDTGGDVEVSSATRGGWGIQIASGPASAPDHLYTREGRGTNTSEDHRTPATGMPRVSTQQYRQQGANVRTIVQQHQSWSGAKGWHNDLSKTNFAQANIGRSDQGPRAGLQTYTAHRQPALHAGTGRPQASHWLSQHMRAV